MFLKSSRNLHDFQQDPALGSGGTTPRIPNNGTRL